MSESESMNVQEESENMPSSSNLESDIHLKKIKENGELSPTSDQQESEKRDNYSSQFNEFKSKFESLNDPEAKLQLAIEFMENSLAQGGTPHFRSFWEARKYCLLLFKENISLPLRSILWAKYSDLSKEARRLKELLDEQSAFAVEQIEIAVQALENDILNFEDLMNRGPILDKGIFPAFLKESYSVYQNFQKQLNLLNVQASRINALRKELLKTEMRVKLKNKFFQRLSLAGDKVFPKRKELIKQLSQQFSEDVSRFIKIHFSEDTTHESLYLLREEIKVLQGLAKGLTLNTHSFTQTRAWLSECWDKIKSEEKDRKKERAHQKILHKQNADAIVEAINLLKDKIEKLECSTLEALKEIDRIVLLMRKTELGRDELKMLRERLGDLKMLVAEKVKAEEEARYSEEKERQRIKKEKFDSLKQQGEFLIRAHEEMEVDRLILERDQLINQMQESSLNKMEKQELERTLKPLKDIITEKREREMLNISDDDRQNLQQLQTVLKQRKERRIETKAHLDHLRKLAGSSGLDFEKAMNFNTQINEEKERLEKANLGIKEIEEKIIQLQMKIKEKK